MEGEEGILRITEAARDLAASLDESMTMPSERRFAVG